MDPQNITMHKEKIEGQVNRFKNVIIGFRTIVSWKKINYAKKNKKHQGTTFSF